MEIKNILYVDDTLENGITAIKVDSRIDYVSAIELIEKPLQHYDCIITDLQMEHSESGLELVEQALNEGMLPWVATGGTYNHGGLFERVKVFNATESEIFDKVSKKEERFWTDLISFIEKKHDGPVRLALEKVKSTLGIVPECTVNMMMQSYRRNK